MDAHHGKAHGASLPLWSILQKHVSSPAWLSSEELQLCVAKLHLGSDIEVVVVFEGSETRVSMEPRTSLGMSVLDELQTRSEFPLCPDGDCEYDGAGVCRWCANPRH